MNARHSKIAAGDEITAPTAVAHEAYPAEPADSDSLAHLPGGHFRAELIDAAGDLVPRHCGIADAGESAGDGKDIAMADAACLDLEAHFARTRLRHRTLH